MNFTSRDDDDDNYDDCTNENTYTHAYETRYTNKCMTYTQVIIYITLSGCALAATLQVVMGR